MFEGINPGEKDYSAIVSKLKSAGVEFLYYGGYHTEAGLILRQAADQGYKFQLMSADGLATAEFWQISGPAGEGTLFTFAADPRRAPTAAKALEQFKAQGYNPEGFTLFSYGVVQAIVEGIKRAGSDDPVKVAQALEERPADRHPARPGLLRRQGRRQGSALRHQPVARRQVRADRLSKGKHSSSERRGPSRGRRGRVCLSKASRSHSASAAKPAAARRAGAEPAALREAVGETRQTGERQRRRRRGVGEVRASSPWTTRSASPGPSRSSTTGRVVHAGDGRRAFGVPTLGQARSRLQKNDQASDRGRSSTA